MEISFRSFVFFDNIKVYDKTEPSFFSHLNLFRIF